MQNRLLICCLLVSTVSATIYKDNITDFSKCQVYYSRSGNVYKDFFSLSPRSLPKNGNLTLDFHFSVLSPSDAHILLASSEKVQKEDAAYEVVIGAGGNTFSDIRRQQKNAVKASVRDKGLLSSLDARSFWIHISRDGVIEVGKEGEDLPFMTWTDPNQLTLKVFSFSTWPGVEAKWFFDCPLKDNSTSKSEELKKDLTDSERLRRNLLVNYDPYSRPVKNPTDITTVHMNLIATSVSHDEHKSVFNMKGAISLMWRDEKLKWNPNDYGGLQDIHIFRREIWEPDLILFNSYDGIHTILQDSLARVNSSGWVRWRPPVSLASWCGSGNSEELWPADTRTCQLVFSFLAGFEYIRLLFNINETAVLTAYSSGWAIEEVEFIHHVHEEHPLVTVAPPTLDPPALQIAFTLKRASSLYRSVFFIPFVFIAASILATFWVSPFGNLKISFGCISMVLSNLLLIGLSYTIPKHCRHLPRLVSLYTFSLLAAVVCIIISTVVINMSRIIQTSDLPYFLRTILSSERFMKILSCPGKDTDEYGKLRNSKIPENQHATWIMFGVAVDKIAFFFYLILIIYAFCVS